MFPLQAPLQPLMDNLESQTYETFERDPIKYRNYENAIHSALSETPADKISVIMVVSGQVLEGGWGKEDYRGLFATTPSLWDADGSTVPSPLVCVFPLVHVFTRPACALRCTCFCACERTCRGSVAVPRAFLPPPGWLHRVAAGRRRPWAPGGASTERRCAGIAHGEGVCCGEEPQRRGDAPVRCCCAAWVRAQCGCVIEATTSNSALWIDAVGVVLCWTLCGLLVVFRNLVRTMGWSNVTIVSSDMRKWVAPEKVGTRVCPFPSLCATDCFSPFSVDAPLPAMAGSGVVLVREWSAV